MKRIVFLFLTVFATLASRGQELRYTDASQLGVIGRLEQGQHLWHRVDVQRYPSLRKPEATLLRQGAGIAVVFRTDSPVIAVRTKYRTVYAGTNSTIISGAGYDLYIRSGEEWLYASSQVQKRDAPDGTPVQMVKDMSPVMKECLMYLPLFSELESIEIGTAEGSTLEKMENPFRRHIVWFGSSYTQGSGTSRSGMTFVAQIQRATGLDFMNLGVSGNSKLQSVFADILCDSGAEAFVVDGFSNPTAEEIETRLFPFIERIRERCPKTPVIFVSTLYREGCNFDLVKQAHFKDRDARAATMGRRVAEEFEDVYFVDIPNLTGDDHTTSTDGTHPSDLGYWRSAQKLQKPLLKIFAKYKIK